LLSSKDSLFHQALYQKNFLLFSLAQYDSLQLTHKLFLKAPKQVNDELYLGKQHHLMGYYYDKVKYYWDSAFYHYSKSKNYFFNIHDSTQIGRRLLVMGEIQHSQNDFFGSKETVVEALKYLVGRDTKYIASCYNALAANCQKSIILGIHH